MRGGGTRVWVFKTETKTGLGKRGGGGNGKIWVELKNNFKMSIVGGKKEQKIKLFLRLKRIS